jgi:hypothetical protein
MGEEELTGSGPTPSKNRVPLLLWGDLVRGEAPVLRRALAGDQAHECMYAWVYLTDFLAQAALLDHLKREDITLASLADLDGPVWERVTRSSMDPNFQISAEGYYLLAALACTVVSSRGSTRLVELGSTFGAALTKWSVISHLMNRERPITYVGIDNSALMAKTTKLLNGVDTEVITDAMALLAQPDSVLLSRFVASYVFPDADAFVNWAAPHFDALAIEDPFTTDGSNWRGQNHGQPETFFSLPDLVDGLLASGYAIGMINAYGDWPAGTTRCHVVKLLGVRDARRWDVIANDFERLSGQPIAKVGSGSELLDDLNESVSRADWTRIRAAKGASPVWGPTPADFRVPPARDTKCAERALGPWRNYRLAGPAAISAIARAVGEGHSEI